MIPSGAGTHPLVCLVFLTLLTVSSMLFVRDSKSMSVLSSIYIMVAMIPICHYLRIGVDTIKTFFRFMGMYMVFGGLLEPVQLVMQRNHYYDAVFLEYYTGIPSGFWICTWAALAFFTTRRLWILTHNEKLNPEKIKHASKPASISNINGLV